MSNESSHVGILGAVGAGLVALLGGIGRFADDIVRVGATGAARAGAGAAGGIDDAARLGSAFGGSADDLARGAGATRSGGTTKFAAEALQHAGNIPFGGDDRNRPLSKDSRAVIQRMRGSIAEFERTIDKLKKSQHVPTHVPRESLPLFPQ